MTDRVLFARFLAVLQRRLLLWIQYHAFSLRRGVRRNECEEGRIDIEVSTLRSP